jgi:hypothetical protein
MTNKDEVEALDEYICGLDEYIHDTKRQVGLAQKLDAAASRADDPDFKTIWRQMAAEVRNRDILSRRREQLFGREKQCLD